MATAVCPSSWIALMIRRAISPRFATSIFLFTTHLFQTFGYGASKIWPRANYTPCLAMRSGKGAAHIVNLIGNGMERIKQAEKKAREKPTIRAGGLLRLINGGG